MKVAAIPNKELTVLTDKSVFNPDGRVTPDDFESQVTYAWYSNTFDLADDEVRLTDDNLPYIRIDGSAVKSDVDRVHIGLRYNVGTCELMRTWGDT